MYRHDPSARCWIAHCPAAIRPAFLTTLKPPGGPWWPAQANTLHTLAALAPQAPRLVYGGGEAVAALCRRFSAQHRWPGHHDLPRLDALLADARQTCPDATHLVVLNGDILVLPSLLTVLDTVAAQVPACLFAARRLNLEPPGDLTALPPAALATRLDALARHHGSLGGIGALDLFAFPAAAFAAVPPLVIGRAGWDNWLVAEALRSGLTVVNGTGAAQLLHQNHSYGHLPAGERSVVTDALARENQHWLQQVTPANLRAAQLWWPRHAQPQRALVASSPLFGPTAGAWFSWCLPPGAAPDARRLAWLEEELEPLAGTADLVLLGAAGQPFAHLAPGDYGLNGLHPWLLPLLWDAFTPGQVVISSALLASLQPPPLFDQAGPWPAPARWLDLLLQLAARGAWFATLPDQPPWPATADGWPLPRPQRAYWETQLLRRVQSLPWRPRWWDQGLRRQPPPCSHPQQSPAQQLAAVLARPWEQGHADAMAAWTASWPHPATLRRRWGW